MKTLTISLTLATAIILVVPSCKTETEQNAVSEDRGLRALFGVSSISATVDCPDDAKVYLVTTLEFLDGQLINRGNASQGNAQGELHIDFLWTDSQEALSTPGGSSRTEGGFWKQTNMNREFHEQDERPSYENYSILGFAQSTIDYEGTDLRWSSGDFNEALQSRKHVAAVVVAFFPDGESADASLHRLLSKNEDKKAESGPGE